MKPAARLNSLVSLFKFREKLFPPEVWEDRATLHYSPLPGALIDGVPQACRDNHAFIESLPGYLPPDKESQRRVPIYTPPFSE